MSLSLSIDTGVPLSSVAERRSSDSPLYSSTHLSSSLAGEYRESLSNLQICESPESSASSHTSEKPPLDVDGADDGTSFVN